MVTVKITVLWYVTPCTCFGSYNNVYDKPAACPFYFEEGGSRFIRNILICLPEQPVSFHRDHNICVITILEFNNKKLYQTILFIYVHSHLKMRWSLYTPQSRIEKVDILFHLFLGSRLR